MDATRVPDFQALFECVPGAYLVLDPELRIVAASEAYLRATGKPRVELLGRALLELFPDEPCSAGLAASLRAVKAHRRADALGIRKCAIAQPAAAPAVQSPRYVRLVNTPVCSAQAELRYIIHSIEDVTELVCLQETRQAQERLMQDLKHEIAERKRAVAALEHSEAQLLQAQKLEAVGRLAGGVAHDFNNFLSVVLSYAVLLLEDEQLEQRYREDVAEMQRAGERAADLTRQLLAFSRQQIPSRRLLDVNEIVSGMRGMLPRLLGEDIDIELCLAPDIPCIHADRGQIEQVLMNLFVNARDAMPAGGRLRIDSDEVRLGEDGKRIHPGLRPGSYVKLSVSDTGTGMDAATQARAFEPFFTTKERGKGTGLGLSTVFGIVTQNGGQIALSSEVGRGTRCDIYLPSSEGVAARASDATGRAFVRGAETILLVEDEEQVRTVIAEILRKHGYHVIETGTPAQALLAAEERSTAIDLLLTDVVMPKMNGRQLAERVCQLRPELQVLYMSGYTDDLITQRGVSDAEVAFIAKPLTPAPLLAKIDELLAASAMQVSRSRLVSV